MATAFHFFYEITHAHFSSEPGIPRIVLAELFALCMVFALASCAAPVPSPGGATNDIFIKYVWVLLIAVLAWASSSLSILAEWEAATVITTADYAVKIDTTVAAGTATLPATPDDREMNVVKHADTLANPLTRLQVDEWKMWRRGGDQVLERGQLEWAHSVMASAGRPAEREGR